MRRRGGLWSEPTELRLVGFRLAAQVATGGGRQSYRIAAPLLALTMPLSFPLRLQCHLGRSGSPRRQYRPAATSSLPPNLNGEKPRGRRSYRVRGVGRRHVDQNSSNVTAVIQIPTAKVLSDGCTAMSSRSLPDALARLCSGTKYSTGWFGHKQQNPE